MFTLAKIKLPSSSAVIPLSHVHKTNEMRLLRFPSSIVHIQAVRGTWREALGVKRVYVVPKNWLIQLEQNSSPRLYNAPLVSGTLRQGHI